MEAVDLIRDALMNGNADATKAIRSAVVQDAYNRLKRLILCKVVDEPRAAMTLDEHEYDPVIWERPLKEELTRIGAAQDLEIINAAQQVMALIDPQQAASGKYDIQMCGNFPGFVQGDSALNTMDLSEESSGIPGQ